jgi:hypothetical protein
MSMSEGITTFRAENTAHLDRRTHSSGSVQRTGRAPLGCRMRRAGTLGRRSRSLSRRGLRSWASGDRTGCSRTRMLTTRLCLGAQTLTQKPTWPNRHRRTAFETHNGRSALAAGTALRAPKPSLPRVWMVASSCPSACELSPNVPRRSVLDPGQAEDRWAARLPAGAVPERRGVSRGLQPALGEPGRDRLGQRPGVVGKDMSLDARRAGVGQQHVADLGDERTLGARRAQ